MAPHAAKAATHTGALPPVPAPWPNLDTILNRSRCGTCMPIRQPCCPCPEATTIGPKKH